MNILKHIYFKILIFIMVAPALYAAGETSGIASNAKKGAINVVIGITDTFKPLFQFIGFIMLAYVIYIVFLDEDPQKRGIGNLIWNISLFGLSILLLVFDRFMHWAFGIPI